MNLNVQHVAPLAAALTAALENRLIAALAERPGTPAELAARCQLDPRACRRILEVLDVFGLTRHDGDRVGIGPELGELASRPLPISLAESQLWNHAPDFLRTGTPLFAMDAAPAEREGLYRDVVAELGKLFAGAADDLAARAGLHPATILDVGCGSGVWSLALARRSPGARVTGLDLPAVLERFCDRAAQLGLADRVETIEGDMHGVTVPPARWEVVIIANVLRLETPDRACDLVKRYAAAVRPGGSLLVIDALTAGTPAADRARAIYAFHLAMRTQAGRVHPPEEIGRWMQAAGLAAPAPIALEPRFASSAAVGALVAKRP